MQKGPNMNADRVVAIDGPAGSGKSTVARLVAERLGFTYLDTGAIYRSLAWLADENGISWDGEDALSDLCRNMHLEFRGREVWVDGQNVTGLIRSEEMGKGASQVSAHPKVRKALLDMQREFAKGGEGLVAEGRDMGTVVFPKAVLKVFLVASVKERAMRRWKELRERGVFPLPPLEEIEESIEQRDEHDSSRKTAPLRKAQNALELDTTGLTIEQVVEQIVQWARERLRVFNEERS